MNNLELANSVLKDVKDNRRSSASKKIQLLLKNNADLKNNWGAITRLAITIGEFNSAVKCSKKYLAVAPNESKRIIQCAAILAECREIKSAIMLVTPLLNKNITPDVLHFLGTAHSQIGDIDLAKKYLIQLINIVPNTAISWLTLSAIHKFSINDDLYKKIIGLQEQLYNDSNVQNAPFWFALGKASLDVKDEKKAFAYFSRGCNLMNNSKSYEQRQHSQFIDNIIASQDTAYLNTLPNCSETKNKPPIFVVGLPRSGTTLLQQILSSHNAIGQGGEVNYLNYILAEIDQGELYNLVTKDVDQKVSTLEKIQSDYQHLQFQQFTLDSPIVDKTLNLNHHLGLISKVFPNAPIIRITRNPVDNAWSCFRNFFNEGVGWSYDLNNIAEFFYHEERLGKHWKLLLGDHILEIKYEELVSKPKDTLKLCLEHCGLEFEEELLSFYKNNALVQTASVGQIRNPINKGSINAGINVKEYLTPFVNHSLKLKTP